MIGERVWTFPIEPLTEPMAAMVRHWLQPGDLEGLLAKLEAEDVARVRRRFQHEVGANLAELEVSP